MPHPSCDLSVFCATLLKAAHETMTGVAEQINEMKRKHESAVHVHEVQSQLQGWVGNDLTTHGELTLEDAFKYYSGRGSNIPFRGTEDRHVFLFKRLILLTKKRDEVYKYKGHIEVRTQQALSTVLLCKCTYFIPIGMCVGCTLRGPLECKCLYT